MNPLLYLAEAMIDAEDAGIPTGVGANQEAVDALIAAVFGIAGVVAVVFIIIGGLRYTISQGDPGQVQRAKDTILYAIVGLVLVIASYTIINFILGRF